MKTKSRTTRLLVGVFVLVLLAVTLVPLAWVVISSFKTQGEMLITPWALPKEWKFSNYAEAWQRGKFLQLMKNSVVITAGSLIFMVLFSTMAAYGITRFHSRFCRGSLLYLLVGQTISAAMIVFPIVLFTRIAIPLAKPALATVLLYQFMWVWNEFPLAFTLISSTEKRTVIVGLYTVVNGQLQTNYVLAFAGAIIVSLPIIVMYLIFQKYLIRGLVSGAVKG